LPSPIESQKKEEGIVDCMLNCIDKIVTEAPPRPLGHTTNRIARRLIGNALDLPVLRFSQQQNK
jgi:hypothetical protein